jgi:hypothetical protein
LSKWGKTTTSSQKLSDYAAKDELAHRAPKDGEMEQMLMDVADVKVSCAKVLALVNERERLPTFLGWVGTGLKWRDRLGVGRRNASIKSKGVMAKTTTGVTAYEGDDIVESIQGVLK